MSTLTIHALDPAVEKRIRSKAKRDGRSLNQTLKELLTISVGVKSKPDSDHRADFAEFQGVWDEQDVRDFENATADFEAIDQSDWQS
jgi:plasmid stability protein